MRPLDEDRPCNRCRRRSEFGGACLGFSTLSTIEFQREVNMTHEKLQDGRPWPWRHGWSIAEMPTHAKDLIGRKVRVVEAGESVGEDHVPGRVTIHVTDDRRIADIKIEQGPVES